MQPAASKAAAHVGHIGNGVYVGEHADSIHQDNVVPTPVPTPVSLLDARKSLAGQSEFSKSLREPSQTFVRRLVRHEHRAKVRVPYSEVLERPDDARLAFRPG